MDNGWIKIHRKLIKWEWYDDINTFKLFIHLLLTVNHENKKWRGILIKKGQRITSLNHLAKETGLSIQSVRTSIKRLKSTHELTHKTTNKYGLFTIINYNQYQSTNTLANSQLTNKQQTTNNKQEYIKNIKNEKNIKISSKEDTEKSDLPEKKEYGKKELNELKKFLLLEFGLADFQESQKMQRRWLMHTYNLIKKKPDYQRWIIHAVAKMKASDLTYKKIESIYKTLKTIQL